MTQAEFASLFDIAQTTLGNYERGRNQPSFELVAAICEKFNVRPEWLIFGIERQNEPQFGKDVPLMDSPFTEDSNTFESYQALVQQKVIPSSIAHSLFKEMYEEIFRLERKVKDLTALNNQLEIKISKLEMKAGTEKKCSHADTDSASSK